VPFDNEAAKRGLIQLLRGSRRAVLLVGAGSSIPVGYPSWPQLLEELRTAVIPELAQFPEMDLLSRAELIRTTLRSYPDHVDRRRQYEQLLSRRFGPRAPSHASFHRTLVQLPFCGFVTTNYDPTIESAATYVQISTGNDFQCGTIDLCGDSPNHAFHFLRELGGGAKPSAVLHVHGFWRRPEQIILSAGDYASRYGIPQAVAIPDQALVAPTRPLDTLHRKVVWSLLTMYPVVFVGFSVEDPAFQLMLGFVHEDFELAPNPPVHFALLGSRFDEDRNRDAQRLRPYSVMPVFYPVVTDANGQPDHSALTALIEELGASVGVSAAPALDDLTRRLMER
jgi:hypothetical protein